jgi:Ca2+-binding RTX toxin-like protein
MLAQSAQNYPSSNNRLADLFLLSGNINGSGNNRSNTLVERSDGNILDGLMASDRLLGNEDNDKLRENSGNDTLGGGLDKDT